MGEYQKAGREPDLEGGGALRRQEDRGTGKVRDFNTLHMSFDYGKSVPAHIASSILLNKYL